MPMIGIHVDSDGPACYFLEPNSTVRFCRWYMAGRGPAICGFRIRARCKLFDKTLGDLNGAYGVKRLAECIEAEIEMAEHSATEVENG